MDAVLLWVHREKARFSTKDHTKKSLVAQWLELLHCKQNGAHDLVIWFYSRVVGSKVTHLSVLPRWAK